MEITYWMQVAAIALGLHVAFFVKNRGGERTRLQRAPFVVQAAAGAGVLLLWSFVPSQWVGRVVVETYPRYYLVTPLLMWVGLCVLLWWRRLPE